MTDHGFGFASHEPQYAIIGTLSQPQTSDNRDCDYRRAAPNRVMNTKTPLRPEAAQVFGRLQALGLKQRDLAEALGLEENKVSKIKAGERQFRGTELVAANQYLDRYEAKHLRDVSEAGSKDDLLISPSEGQREVVQIQKLDLSLSMGPGTLIDGYVETELISFDLEFVRQFSRTPSDRLRIVTGVGDSMEPTLYRNDLIVIDTNDRRLSKQDGIYWINLYGAAGIKRLRAIGPNKVLVKSDNPIHGDQEVDANDLRIEGRAVWTTRGL